MRISDWSSDVCSSDLDWANAEVAIHSDMTRSERQAAMNASWTTVEGLLDLYGVKKRWYKKKAKSKAVDEKTGRKSVVEGKSVSVRVDLGGRRIIKKKKTQKQRKIQKDKKKKKQ